MRNFSIALFLAIALSAGARAELKEGPGREAVEKLCKTCHEVERSVSKRQDRDGWQATITKMIALGTKGTDQEFAAILDYLVKHYPAEDVPPLNVNTATAIQLESRLSLRRSQAAALIAYRKEHGAFKTINDLKAVPGIDPAKIDEKAAQIIF